MDSRVAPISVLLGTHIRRWRMWAELIALLMRGMATLAVPEIGANLVATLTAMTAALLLGRSAVPEVSHVSTSVRVVFVATKSPWFKWFSLILVGIGAA